MINLKNLLSKKFVLLFILSTLLTPSGAFNAQRAVAQANPVSLQFGANPNEFDKHNSYRSLQLGKDYRAKWEVDMNFIGTLIDAKWIIHVEQKQKNGKWILTDEYIMNLECEKQGNVEIQDNAATFNPEGRGHISCDIPSFRNAVQQLLGMELDEICDSINPWADLDYHVTPNGQREYPLISLNTVRNPSAVFEATIQRQRRNRAYVETLIDGWDYPEKSNTFNIHKPQTFWTGINPMHFIETLNERQNRYPNIWTAFWTTTNLNAYLNRSDHLSKDIWLSWIESRGNKQSVADVQATRMYTEEMTLYIGHSPKTELYFGGQMTNIGVDPGCAGLGGK